jgi:hypothetical protein
VWQGREAGWERKKKGDTEGKRSKAIEENTTDMCGHIRKPSNPFIRIKVGVSEPGVAVVQGAAPHGFRDMVIEVQVDTLSSQLFSDSIKDLSY